MYPAPGFTVTCPGFALGHEGMTCYHVTGICPGAKEIVVADVQAFVVANEFENSRIFMGLPVRCRVARLRSRRLRLLSDSPSPLTFPASDFKWRPAG